MIARQENVNDNLWARIAAALPAGTISWRQDGRPIQRDGKFFARFVAYIDANTVSRRLDEVVPGEWDLTLSDPLKELMEENGAASYSDTRCAFKARLQILGVIREDVGHGHDYKQASTDAFKRAAVRFGIGRELYDMEHVYAQVDGDGKYAKPVEDPAEVYARKLNRSANNGVQKVRSGNDGAGAHVHTGRAGDAQGQASGQVLGVDGIDERPIRGGATQQVAEGVRASADLRADVGRDLGWAGGGTPMRQPAMREAESPVRGDSSGEPARHGVEGARSPIEEVSCPKCGGRTWDNRLSKKNPKAPDFKCRSRSCDGVIWPMRNEPDTSNGNPATDADDELPY